MRSRAGGIGDVDPADPVVGVADIELAHRLGKPGVTHEIRNRASSSLAGAT